MAILSAPQEFTFTHDQEDALHSIKTFLEGDQSVFLLKGYAGTGKTTLVKEICQYISEQGLDFGLMAPTGRAAMVLNSRTGHDDASTIHRGIYNLSNLKEREEGTSFRFYFELHANKDSERCIYLVDEASMVSNTYSDNEFYTFGSGYLLQDLIAYAKIPETNRKIIFVGDHAQLPPVNMPFSPALNADHIAEKSGAMCQEATLREVVRQDAESHVLQAATGIRQSIEKGDYSSFRIPISGKDTQEIPLNNFDKQFYEAASQYGLESCIVITHANHQALTYNKKIRSLRYGGDGEQVLQQHERLLITKNNYNGPVDLFNGMFAEVLEVGGICYQANPYFKIKGGKTINRSLTFRSVLVEVTDVNGQKHPIRTTLLENFLWTQEGHLHPYDQRALYIDFKNRMDKENIKEKDNSFTDRLLNDPYFNTLQAKFGYAITCHKSQGGEWPVVMVDFRVFIGRMTEPFFRWSYTAITRTDQSLICIDPPDFNAFNQFVIKPIEQISKVLKGAYYVPSNSDEPYYFVEYRKQAIARICEDQGIELDITPHNHQLAIRFSKASSHGRVQLWYSNNGFTTVTWHPFNDEAFKGLIQTVLLESILPDPDELVFKPKFDFQEGLHKYLLELLKEEDIPLTNVVQDDWKDQYFLYTGANCSVIEFFYNKKGIYTKAQPKSSLGHDDTKLQALLDKLSGAKA